VNRTVGLTLRCTAGSGVMFALGVGALALTPQAPVPTSAAASALPIESSIPEHDQPSPHERHVVPIVYVEAAQPTAAALVSRPVPAPVPHLRPAPAFTGGPTAFTYGYCTWWVSHKRTIPWRGNAAQWWWNARALGFAEGSVPRVGSIMVLGVSRSSPSGHVAYVESVNPNGSFLVSEMNWWGVPGGGWGRVDYRTVTSTRGMLGFIY
jgi:surface antigen